MFRRKDEDIAHDLLGSAEAENAPKSEGTENSAAGEAYKANPVSAAAPSNPTPAVATVPPYAPRTATEPQQQRATAATPIYRPAGAPTGDASRGRVPEYRPAASAPGSFAGASAANTADKSQAKANSRRVLTVGNDILLKGEIATCDRLVIEGAVDATLNEVHTVEIAEGGSFKGSAEIEDAEISGLFEGELTVRNRLIIYATGKVRGKITYGEIEIERGGELTGEIKTMAQSAHKKGTATPQAKGKTPLEAAAAA